MKNLKKFNENFENDEEMTGFSSDEISDMENRIYELVQDSFQEPELSQLLENYTTNVSGQLKLTGEIEAKYQSTPEFGEYTFEIIINRIA